MSADTSKTVEQLREENALLLKAVERFAFIGAVINPDWGDYTGITPSGDLTLVAIDFREAHNAFKKAGGEFKSAKEYYVEGYESATT